MNKYILLIIIILTLFLSGCIDGNSFSYNNCIHECRVSLVDEFDDNSEENVFI